ncbi:MAG TPA: SGNH/GDSL hydrolase family protein [Lapillicoccus sp.]|uniref:SGNH/GDSL hydrolase family protein n=1 Tax=Lapillicoccus sp. TaxID=1909287 RepID=UPI002F91C4F5
MRAARLVLVLIATATLFVVGLAAPAQAAPPSYVALGDSYSSGVGTRSYLNDGSSCQRSVYAYPSLIAAAKGYALNFRACSGATVADVTNSQLSALSSANAYVTISVGGNDAGFASVLTTCAQPSWLSNCTGAVDGAQRYIANTLPGSLGTLYASIRAKAPNAKVVVVGYPRIFNGTDCNLLTWFSGSEMTRLNQTADQLDATISVAAKTAGFGFVSPVQAFVGHAVCDRSEWINGLSSPVTESFHPNRSGQASGYTPLVSPALVGAAVAVTPAVLQKAAASADGLAAQQRSYAGVDATITPKRFEAPARTISPR